MRKEELKRENMKKSTYIPGLSYSLQKNMEIIDARNEIHKIEFYESHFLHVELIGSSALWNFNEIHKIGYTEMKKYFIQFTIVHENLTKFRSAELIIAMLI